MKLTVDHILDLISLLPINKSFDYVSGGESKAKLISIDRENVKVEIVRVNADGSEKNASMTTDILNTLATNIKENKPFKFDNILNGSGNVRSTMEAIFAHTAEFYSCKIRRVKHLIWIPSMPHEIGKIVNYDSIKDYIDDSLHPDSSVKDAKYLPYLTALRTKPFMLLAGISGTGKSRIVRELAKACWKEGDEEFGKNHPRNFCMVQVKPNWHDSSELIGYVSRINGEKYVVGPFLRFLAKAINDPDTPYFLCLDEMNLAPVEQYFAEYLSVIESRKQNADGSITTDPIIPYENTEAYGTLIDQLFADEADRKAYKSETDGKRLTIPQNLFVVGTVNMDETTFSFSRKVLDRAMTLEMNEVNLHSGLTDEGSEIGYIGNCIIGTAAEGKDVYADNKELCDQVLAYLEKVNAVLEGTPFKIAYRTRNEFLLYVVNRQLLDEKSQLWQTLDEMTSMKILSRIEGDSERTKSVLESLKVLVEEEINKAIPEPEEGKEKLKSISDAKIKEMLDKLEKSGYTSYWA